MVCHYFLVSCCRYFQHKYISPTLKGAQKLPNLHSSPNCWHDISNNKNFPKLLAAYFHYFKNVYSPTLPPNSPTIIPSDEYPTPTYIFNLHILPKLFAAYIQNKYIFEIYIFPHRNYPTCIIKGCTALDQKDQYEQISCTDSCVL